MRAPLLFLVFMHLDLALGSLIENVQQTVTGAVIQSEDGVNRKQCERMCQLMPDCLAVIMVWTDASMATGTCTAVSEMTGQTSDPSTTVFSKCPLKMTYLFRQNICYAVFNNGQRFDDAMASCTNLHPRAHLMETRTEKQLALFNDVLGTLNPVWLSARREDGGGLRDFRWQYSQIPDSLEGYSWSAGHPQLGVDFFGTFLDTHCVRRENGLLKNVDCGAFAYFVCIFDY